MSGTDRSRDFRDNRKRTRHCRDCNAELNGEVSVRCPSCQLLESRKQRERDEADRVQSRSEAIEKALPDITHGWLLMLANLALIDDTNRIEAYYEVLMQRICGSARGLAGKLPTKPARIGYRQTWEGVHEFLLEAGEGLKGFDKNGEIPDWPRSIAGQRDWDLPLRDVYVLAREIYTEIVPELATKGHRQRWQNEMLPCIPEILNVMEMHHNDLYDENTAMSSAVTELETFVDEVIPELQNRPLHLLPTQSLLDIWQLLDLLESGELSPYEVLPQSLESGKLYLEPTKFETILSSFSE